MDCAGTNPSGQWVRGYYVCYGGAIPRPSHHIIHAMDNLNRLVGENTEISQYNLCRCIGLFSADKKLLFENDVVEYGPEKTRVLIQWGLKSMAYKAIYSTKLEDGQYETQSIPCDIEFQHNIGNLVSRGADFHRILTEDAERRGIPPWRISPVKVGDSVWVTELTSYSEEWFVDEHIVESVAFVERGISFITQPVVEGSGSRRCFCLLDLNTSMFLSKQDAINYLTSKDYTIDEEYDDD